MGVLAEIIEAVESSGESRYRISLGSGVSQGQLSRLVRGQGGVSIDTLERLADYLAFEVVLRKKRGTAKARKKG